MLLLWYVSVCSVVCMCIFQFIEQKCAKHDIGLGEPMQVIQIRLFFERQIFLGLGSVGDRRDVLEELDERRQRVVIISAPVVDQIERRITVLGLYLV